MRSREKGVALLLINVWIKRTILFFILAVFWELYWTGCSQNSYSIAEPKDPELEILQRGSRYIERGEYEKAWDIYSQFIIKFPNHPFVDDAAYRAAYLHVIADDKNLLLNYQKAALLFQKFIENYPNSRYINACKNWLNVLNKIITEPVRSVRIETGRDLGFTDIDQLKKELLILKEENTQLKKTLEDLQKAIER